MPDYREYTIGLLVLNQSHPGILSLTIPSCVGTVLANGDGLGYRNGRRKGEFCVTVALYQDCWILA